MITVRQADGTTQVVPPGHFRKWKPEHWREVRLQAKIRDGFACTVCGGDERLECHHLTYAREGCERLDDVVTLCQRCHATEHQWLRRRYV